MNASPILRLSLMSLTSLLVGCQGWIMDYGKPAAQFEAHHATAVAPDFLGRKVSVRGRVSAVDTSNPDHCIVQLGHGVTADFGKSRRAAEACKVGEVVHISGIVKAAGPAGVTLAPAFGRDPDAPFNPLHP